jgi:hypothetical protein
VSGRGFDDGRPGIAKPYHYPDIGEAGMLYLCRGWGCHGFQFRFQLARPERHLLQAPKAYGLFRHACSLNTLVAASIAASALAFTSLIG